jgi:hypothetical protein
VLVGCATVPYKPITLPITIDARFDRCVAGDGLGRMTLDDAKSLRVDFDLEWVIRNDVLDSQMFNSLGETLLSLKIVRDPPQVTLDGRVVEKLPSIEVDSDGFLEVDDKFVGIKAWELACFLKHRFPRPWLDHVRQLKENEKTIVLKIEDDERDIDVRANMLPIESIEVCSTIKWRNIFGMVKSQIEICNREEKGTYSTVFSGYDNYVLKWVDSNEL